jgi:hypothetical protein
MLGDHVHAHGVFQTLIGGRGKLHGMKFLTTALFMIAAACAQHPCYAGQDPPPATSHLHSNAARALLADPHLRWAADFCDEENPFVDCHNVTLHGPTFKIGLKSAAVAMVMLNNKVLKPTEYKLSHTEKPLEPQPEGFHAMTGLRYSDQLIITRPAIGRKEMVIVFYQGYKGFEPHHTEDEVK